MAGKKMIQVSEELHRFLTAQAVKKSETYDEIIKRILKEFVGVSLEEVGSPESEVLNKAS